ncbi:MAG: transcription antitermination factor NusB, partial [Myxococcota bacterium]|nr:transcription antitermination factor NusB [Myxococcota bacterium]
MPRRLAQQVLARVLDPEEDAYSHLALDAALSRSELDARDRGLATELVYGTLTWLSAIDLILDKAVKGGTRRLDADVLLILRLSV